MPDVHLRLVLYKRIASAEGREDLDELKVEMVDRFGPLPPYTQSLFRGTTLKLRAAELGIRKIDAGPASGYFVFDETNRIDPKRVLKLLQGRSKEYRLDGPLKPPLHPRCAHRGQAVHPHRDAGRAADPSAAVTRGGSLAITKGGSRVRPPRSERRRPQRRRYWIAPR